MKNMLGTLSLSDVQGPRDDLEKRLAGPDGSVWLAELKKFLRKEICWSDFFDPDEFFVIREGLWVSESFCDDILSVAKSVAKKNLVSSLKLAHFDLAEDMNDEKIRAKLGEGHVFGASEACSIIGNMISLQPNGKEGGLLSNGYLNIFYVRGKDHVVFAVDVYWSAGGRGWRVSAYRLDDIRWDAGFRAFSRNSILAR